MEPKTERKTSILLVDDEPDLLVVNRQLLASLGHSVHTVQNGQEAVEFLRENDVDLVVLDMMMPVMDGVATLEAIRDFKPDQKVVILSAYAEQEQIQAVKKLGVYAYMQKPVDLKAMNKTIEDAIAGIRARDL